MPRTYLWVAGAVALLLVLNRVDSHHFPLGTIVYGILYGSLNGVLALGLVLIYRVSRCINFAYGAMGGLPAGVSASLYLSHRTPWLICIVVSVVLGGLVGVAVGALINWRFSRSPRLILTVATIGLAQLLGGIGLYVPRWFHGPALIPSFRTGLTSWHAELNPVLFNGNDVLVVLAVPLIVALVSWFLLGTDAGRAVRAIADNPERARLVGIPARRLMLAVWALSGVVAALAVILQAPSAGVPLDAAAGPAILLAPLAAAIVARMSSLPGALLAGIGLGVLESLVRLDVDKQSIETPVFLAVILVALLLQHRTGSRAEAADEAALSSVGALRALPDRLSRLTEVRAGRTVASLAVVALALCLPAVLSPGRLNEVSVGLVFAMAALSLVVLSGWSGTVSLGQMAIVGVGAITAGDLMAHLDLDFFLSLLAACTAGAVAAVVLGLPALRVRGLYLAATTLAFAVAANDFFFNPSNFSTEIPASVLKPVLWKRFPLTGQADLYLLCLGLLAAALFLTLGLRRGRPGRAMLATRDNSRGAEASAVPAVRTKLLAFIISGVLAGMAGAMYVVILGGVGYQTFPPVDSVTVFSMVVIGGTSSVGGSLAGVALIQWIGIAFPKAQILLTGVGLLVVLMVFPAGLAGLYERARDRVIVALARRRGIDTSVWGHSDRVSGDEVGTTDMPTREVPLTADPGPSDRRPILTCAGVNAAYGSMQVLFGVDLTVYEGEIVALLGTNGAGKSSLLRSVTGLLPVRSGRVVFDGCDISAATTEAIVSSGLTMMPGGRGIFPSLTVDENLRVAAWPMRRDAGSAAAARRDALELFPVLGDRMEVQAGNLSGGEQQMLSLAMAFMAKPRLLCIDELSLGLAPTIVDTLLDAVRRIHAEGVTVVIVEQSVNVALLLAERATFLEKGQVRFTGPAGEILERPDLLRAVFIGGGAPRSAMAAGGPPPTDGAERSEATTVLECRGISKRFGGITAVDDVDLTVARGEVVGLIGHNGAGKTTLFDLLSGFLEPDSGRIYLEGEDITAFPAWARAVIGLGRSFQEARLFPSLTVAETLSVAFDRHLENRDPVAAAFRMPAATDSESDIAGRVEELVDRFGLGPYRDRPAGDLSTGTRRIVELACVVAQAPTLMLLDEPSGGVAQSETEALGPMLRDVATETGCSMIVIEHDMNLLSNLCDRLVALELGAVITSGSPGDVLSHPGVIASYLGTEPGAVARSGRTRRAQRARKALIGRQST